MIDELQGLPKDLDPAAQLPAAFSKLLRPAFHGELTSARIAHLFKNKLGGHAGCKTVARAKKASPELAFLAEGGVEPGKKAR